MTPSSEPEASSRRATVQWIGLAAGPLLAIATYLAMPDQAAGREGQVIEIAHAGRATAAVGVWMATWWMTEAIPVYATALIPLSVLPLAGAVPMRAAAAPYGHELIFLFMGGFVLALAMQRWNLHRRVAFLVLQRIGAGARRTVAAFMIATAALSMWVSNTATAIMMLPVALSVIELASGGSDAAEGAAGASFRDTERFGIALLLGIAYAASIGGIGTLIGTPPNLFLASYASSQLGIEISMVRWMGVGIPLVLLFLPITWWLLTFVIYPLDIPELASSDSFGRDALAGMGSLSRGERITLVVFTITCACWVTRPLLSGLEVAGVRPFSGLSDAGIAMTAALSLFVIPVDPRRRIFAMDWETAAKLPWGLLVLFGGGLSLASAIRDNGIGEFLVSRLEVFSALPTPVLVVAVTTLVIFLTELTSNTATTAVLVPILASMSQGLGLSPLLLAVPAAIAASCAFMLPVATPPNAVVFGSGLVPISAMTRAGFTLNLIGIVLVTALLYEVAIPVLGMSP